MGRQTFVNLVDQLNATGFPTTTVQLFIIFGFIGQLASFILKPKISIEDENKQVVIEAGLKDIPLTADAPTARAIVALHGLQWPHPGRYVVKFTANGDRVLASFPISLNLVQPQGTTRGTQGAS